MLSRSQPTPKLHWVEQRVNLQALPHVAMVGTLFCILLLYGQSIVQNQFFLGTGDRASRFLTALDYARDLGQAFSVEAWLDVWPPVPFILQGVVLRFVLFPGMTDVSAGIMALQLTGVLLVLFGFYFVARAIALQTDEWTALLVFIFALRATTLMYLAPSTSSEIYAFFFVAFAIWNLFRFLVHGHGFGWVLTSLVLAFFCRNETIVVAFVTGVFLVVNHRWRFALLLFGTILAVATGKLAGALLLIEGTKFFEFGALFGWGATWQDRLQQTQLLLRQFWLYNRTFLVFGFICALPMVYYAIKLQATSGGIVGERRSANTTGAGFIAWFIQRGDRVRLWFASIPLFFWAACFLATIAILLQQALQGNINAQWRYLYLANIFLTTSVALLLSEMARTIFAKAHRAAKGMALGAIAVLVALSLWSGIAHATGRKVGWTMPLSMQEAISMLHGHALPDDQVAFDFLLWQETAMAVLVSNPSHFARPTDDPVLTALVSDAFAHPPERWIAYTHAFIHVRAPRFLVVAGPQMVDDIQERQAHEQDLQSDVPIDRIRHYLTPVARTESVYLFQSPHIFPEKTIRFEKIFENELFVILERNHANVESNQSD